MHKSLSVKVAGWLLALGSVARFLSDLVRSLRDVETWAGITTVRTHRIRVDSLSIALFIAFTGVVLALQACYTFTGAVPLYFVGTLVGKTLMVELSPEVVA